MKNLTYKKIILLMFVFAFFVAPKAHASVITLVPSKSTVGIDEQFYVDVMLDPEDTAINGIEGSVSFAGDNISFVRAETGKSLISLWIEQPELKDNAVSFSGIIPSGFSGVIDPFNPDKKLPGLMVRLVFVGKKSDMATIYSAPFSLTLNDGRGSIISAPGASVSVVVQNVSVPFQYKNQNDTKPELDAYVTRDQNLFNNNYTLVFQAKDSETGIKDVMIKEGNRSWKKITSPYLLEDQSRHSTITLEAENFSGATIVLVINPLPYVFFSKNNVVLLIVFIIILFFIAKKIYEKRKKQENI